MKIKTEVLIFTGGHHTSGLAVAKLLTKSKVKIIWFGHRYSSWGDENDSAEYQEVVNSNIEFINLDAGKFHRTFSPLKLMLIPVGFVQGFLRLLSLKFQYNIKGIVSFGGYLAVPVVISGWLLRIPAVTHEQTMVSGWANRVISKFVTKIAISWPQSQKYFPIAKTVIVGLPLRLEILSIKSRPQRGLIYITGGKQGSHLINQLIFTSLPELIKNYRILHQTGSNSVYQDYLYAQSKKSSRYEPFTYVDSYTTSMNLQKADLVISRAGAHIIAELLYLQKPCILIPIPWGSHNEQVINAQFLASQGLAVILSQNNLTTKDLLQAISATTRLAPHVEKFNYHGLSNFAKLISHEFQIET